VFRSGVVDIVTEQDFALSNERTLPLEGFIVVSFYRDYDITPDGEKLLMMFPEDATESSGPPPQRIHIVLNWLEEGQKARAEEVMNMAACGSSLIFAAGGSIVVQSRFRSP
jgi:hypothetical protein